MKNSTATALERQALVMERQQQAAGTPRRKQSNTAMPKALKNCSQDNSDYRFKLPSEVDHGHYQRYGGQGRTAVSSLHLSLGRKNPSSWRLARHLTSALERLHIRTR